MRVIEVKLAPESYKIHIGRGILGKIGELLRRRGLEGKAAVVTNFPIGKLYSREVMESLREAGFLVREIRLPEGERSKTLKWANFLYDQFLTFQMDRKSTVVALGGGVIGDLGGFVAATYLRGVPYVQVPTSLLAQVDSSVGGKVAVNHPKAKNIIGAFYQPKMVLIDLHTLSTLPERELRSGLAEVIKYGVILDREFFEYLEKNITSLIAKDLRFLERAVYRSCQLKAEVVEKDERERGVRSILNYGHTIGHAVEAATNYRLYRHGEAVSIGMTGAALLSRRLGLLDEGSVRRQVELLKATGLPTKIKRMNLEKIMETLKLDKKAIRGRSLFALTRGLGHAIIIPDVSTKLIKQILRELRE